MQFLHIICTGSAQSAASELSSAVTESVGSCHTKCRDQTTSTFQHAVAAGGCEKTARQGRSWTDGKAM